MSTTAHANAMDTDLTPSKGPWTEALAALPLVAILRGITPAECDAVGDALWALGYRVLEVPLNSPEPFKSIERLVRRLPGAIVGAGTVLTVPDVAATQAAGGRIVVSPNFDASVVQATRARGLISLPGVFTPSEAFDAARAGASGVKLFPAEVHGPAGLRALRAVLPAQVLVFPVGGVSAGNLAQWRAAGASGAGIGSALYQPGKALAQLAADARAFVSAWHGSVSV